MGALDPCDPTDRVLQRMVGATGTSYHCPSASIVQRHLTGNCERIKACLTWDHPAAATQARALQVDQAMLLDRLLWLVWAGPDSPSAIRGQSGVPLVRG
jgi:hypothetical protein